MSSDLSDASAASMNYASVCLPMRWTSTIRPWRSGVSGSRFRLGVSSNLSHLPRTKDSRLMSSTTLSPKPNNMKLKKKTEKTLDTISVVRLREIHDELVAQAALAKKQIEEIKGELLNRYKDEALQEIFARGKEHGEHTIEKDGVKIVCEVGHKVTWDTEKLKAIASTLSPETVQRLLKVTITVPERVYQSVTEKDLLDKLTDARTVKYENPKFSFQSPKD